MIAAGVLRDMTNQALETVGVDPRELTEADEFFGTAALKSYNTFVRPRPKQLAKVRLGGTRQYERGRIMFFAFLRVRSVFAACRFERWTSLPRFARLSRCAFCLWM